MKQETFLDTCKVLVNLPLLFDEEYIVTKTHSSLRNLKKCKKIKSNNLYSHDP